MLSLKLHFKIESQSEGESNFNSELIFVANKNAHDFIRICFPLLNLLSFIVGLRRCDTYLNSFGTHIGMLNRLSPESARLRYEEIYNYYKGDILFHL